MTIASTGWELLAQLATCAYNGTAPVDAERCARMLADLVARYLPVRPGAWRCLRTPRSWPRQVGAMP